MLVKISNIMNIKYYGLVVMLLISGSTKIIYAQNSVYEKELREFRDFVEKEQNDFERFVEEQNREFAKMLKEDWELFNFEEPFEYRKKPEPVKPINYVKKDANNPPKEINIDKYIDFTRKPLPKNNDEDEDEEKDIIEEERIPGNYSPEEAKNEIIEFEFYGNKVKLNATLKGELNLKSINESDVSEAWSSLCELDYRPTIDNCLFIKEKLQLNDYGYMMFVEKAADTLCGTESSDTKKLMQMFILSQSGFITKIARIDSRLEILFATDDIIYQKSYVNLNGSKYYLCSKSPINSPIYTYQKDFGNSNKQYRMSLDKNLKLESSTKYRKAISKAYPEMVVETAIPDNLISFFADYPQCDFSLYYNAKVDNSVSVSVVEQLRRYVQGKDEELAANMLINFVQTGFEYKTDDEQFGYEKPFFVEEVFYYPYCDCEDRAILYSYLVREILKLDVVLIEYPNHLATAVCFNKDIEGDNFIFEGKKYIICDPTYIGASIGKSMPQFANTNIKVLKY